MQELLANGTLIIEMITKADDLLTPDLVTIFVSFFVLFFGYWIFRLIMQKLDIENCKLNSYSTSIIIITTIAITSMFVASLNRGTDAVSSVITLMGTIVGFLLGQLVERSKRADKDDEREKETER